MSRWLVLCASLLLACGDADPCENYQDTCITVRL